MPPSSCLCSRPHTSSSTVSCTLSTLSLSQLNPGESAFAESTAAMNRPHQSSSVVGVVRVSLVLSFRLKQLCCDLMKLVPSSVEAMGAHYHWRTTTGTLPPAIADNEHSPAIPRVTKKPPSVRNHTRSSMVSSVSPETSPSSWNRWPSSSPILFH
jgi:hypothetical protein